MYIWHASMFALHLLSWALHEIKRTNPCNMHDEIHEYVEGKKGLWKTLCRAYTVGSCKITANFKHSTKRETTTFPQRQTTTAYSQWAESSGRDKPIMLHASLRTWHYYEMPTWAVLWHGRAKWTYTICVCMCVHVRVCLNLCFPVRKCGLACDCACVHQQECFSCQVRVNSSCGQLCLLLSRQQIAMRRDKMKGDGRTQEEDCEVGLSGIPQWSQYGKNTMDSRKISHDPLLFEQLSNHSEGDTRIWMNIKAKQNYYWWSVCVQIF